MLRLFGKPHVVGDNGPRSLPAKAFVLVALLRLDYGGIASREQLRVRLWEDAAATSARDNLRWLLSRIRKWQIARGETLLQIDDRAVRTGETTADIDRLLSAPRPTSVGEVRSLVELTSVEFLDGIEGEVSPQLLADIAGWRADLRRRATGLVLPALERTGGPEGERLLRDLLRRDPEDEVLLRVLMSHLARENGWRAVEEVYQPFEDQLRRNGGLPTLETQALYASLRPAAGVATSQTVSPDRTAGSGGIPRIALLTPPSIGASTRSSLLADALIEDVTLRLCRQRTFAMLAPYTAKQLEGADPVAAVAPVEASYVAVTRLVPGQSGLVLNVALIRTDSREIVVGERFDFDESDLEARFADLAAMLTSHLNVGVEAAELSDFRRTGAASAYIHYLLGTKAFDPHDLKNLRKARHSYERALSLDPRYVPALTGKARCLTKEALAVRRRDPEMVGKAMELADQAERIDPRDPNAPREKAHASLYLHDIDASLEYVDIALSRARHHADILSERADILVHASRHAEARATALKAISLNPLPPDDYYWNLGAAEFFLDRFEPAVVTLERMKRPETASRLLAASAAMAGDLRKAAKYRRRFISNFPDSRVDNVREFMPHKNKGDVERYIEALRRAGFP